MDHSGSMQTVSDEMSAVASEGDQDANDKAKPLNSGWYFGKYMGRSNSKEPKDGAAQSESSSSRWFSGSGSGSTPAATSDPTLRNSSDEEQQTESEEQKSEKIFVRMVRSIRNKFVARKLDGSIFIRRICGVVSAAMTCDIKSSQSVPERLQDEDVSDLPSQFQRAITTTDLILDSLERRSLGWEGTDFNGEVSITRGILLGISDPFFGLVNWSITVEVTATVKSLLVSRKRYLLMRASSVSRSSFRFPSFSYSTSKNENALCDAASNPGANDQNKQDVTGSDDDEGN